MTASRIRRYKQAVARLLTAVLVAASLCGCSGKHTVSNNGPWAAKADDRFAWTHGDWRYFGTRHFTTHVFPEETVQYPDSYFCIVYDPSPIQLYDGWRRTWPIERGIGWRRFPRFPHDVKAHPEPLPIGALRVYYTDRLPYRAHRGTLVNPSPSVILEIPEPAISKAGRDLSDSKFIVRAVDHESRTYVQRRFVWHANTAGKRWLVLREPDLPNPFFIDIFVAKKQNTTPSPIALKIYAVSPEQWDDGVFATTDLIYQTSVPPLPGSAIATIKAFFE